MKKFIGYVVNVFDTKDCYYVRFGNYYKNKAKAMAAFNMLLAINGCELYENVVKELIKVYETESGDFDYKTIKKGV